MDKDEIFNKIAKLFKEKGFYTTSIKDISEDVGLKGGSLYYHIKSKEDALFKICEDAINTLLASIETVATTESDPKKRLIKMIETQIDYFTTNFYKTSVFLIETKALGDRYQALYTQKRDRFESHMRKALKEGAQTGVFRKGDEKFLSFAILGMLNWMVIWYNPGGSWGVNKIKKDFIKMILSGIEKQEIP